MFRLHGAEGLRAADRGGSSDPYVVVRLGKAKYKSGVVHNSLNPMWDEQCFLACSEVDKDQVVSFEVMDKDTLMSDFLGAFAVDLTDLTPTDGVKEYQVELAGKKAQGTLSFSVSRIYASKEVAAKKSRGLKSDKISRRQVVVQLIQGINLVPKDPNETSDPYVVLKIGKVKHTSSTVSRSLQPEWRQRFDFTVSSDIIEPLKLKVMDSDVMSFDDKMGYVEVDLNHLKPNVVHELWHAVALDGKPAGHLNTLISIQEDPAMIPRDRSIGATASGDLKVKVVRASNLKKSDVSLLSASSDAFVEVEVGGDRVRTPIVPNSSNPMFNYTLDLPIRDIYGVVRITVWDFDEKSRSEFLGTLLIPLLEIRNGKEFTYELKDKTLTKRHKGEITLALTFNYNYPLALLDVFTKPTTMDTMEAKPKFKTSRLSNASERLNVLVTAIVEVITVSWEVMQWNRGPSEALAAMLGWSVFCIIFRVWQIPVGLIAITLYNLVFNFTGNAVKPDKEGLLITDYDSSESGGIFDYFVPGTKDLVQTLNEPGAEGEEEQEESNASLLEQIAALRKVGLQIQIQLENLADQGERIKNLHNWSIPQITFLYVVVLVAVTAILALIPFNILVMLIVDAIFVAFGVDKYSEKAKWDNEFLKPSVAFARVPSDVDKIKRTPLVHKAKHKSMFFKPPNVVAWMTGK